MYIMCVCARFGCVSIADAHAMGQSESLLIFSAERDGFAEHARLIAAATQPQICTFRMCGTS